MATIAIQAMTVHPFMSEGYCWEAMEGSTQTFLAGAMVKWTSGFIVAAATDDADLAGITLGAGKNLAANGTKPVIHATRFTPMFPGLLLEGNLAQAAADTVSAIASHIGVAFGLALRTTGTTHWVIDSADTTNIRVRVVGYAAGSVNGDTNARVIATVLGAASATSLVRSSAWF